MRLAELLPEFMLQFKVLSLKRRKTPQVYVRVYVYIPIQLVSPKSPGMTAALGKGSGRSGPFVMCNRIFWNGKRKATHSCNFSIALSHPAPSVIISPAESAQQVGLKQLRNDLAKTGMKKDLLC